ncbi:MAG: NAD(P)-dependent oxidoreductase [Paludibacter sp.]|nr:NAD(P)-dependent oxidoreductase [Paludibacter sp.]
MKSKTKVLITGASSDLMEKFIEKIDAENYEIYAITRDKNHIINESVHVLEGDISDSEFVNNALNGVQIIVHAAAVTHKLNPTDYFKVNFQGTVNLVNAAKLNGVEKFIFISSRAAVQKSGAYGLSKLQAEQYIQNNFNKWLIFRPSEVYGIEKEEGIQKLIRDISTKKFVICPINVKSKLYPIHVDDVIKIMNDFIFKFQSHNEIITINGEEGYSYLQLIRHISKIISKKVVIIPVPKTIMDVTKWIIERTGIQIGIAPDQIPRLYSYKENQHLNYDLLSLKDYLIK